MAESDCINQFYPNWRLHPGTILADCLERRGYTFQEFAALSGMDDERLAKIFSFQVSLDWIDIMLIAESIGPSRKFWRNCQNTYDRRGHDPEVSDLSKRVYARNTRYLM